MRAWSLVQFALPYLWHSFNLECAAFPFTTDVDCDSV